MSIKVKAEPNKRVDTFLKLEKKWKKEIEAMRKLALTLDVVEDLKWGQPCYIHAKSNVFILGGFKEYFAVMFFKGSLMKDPKKLLIQPTTNVQASRQIRFTSLADFEKKSKVVKAYIQEAIDIEAAGLKPEMIKSEDREVPEDLQKLMKKVAGFTSAFKKLTPGRQRSYILHFEGAKQEATKLSRMEKALPNILAGKGFNER